MKIPPWLDLLVYIHIIIPLVKPECPTSASVTSAQDQSQNNCSNMTVNIIPESMLKNGRFRIDFSSPINVENITNEIIIEVKVNDENLVPPPSFKIENYTGYSSQGEFLSKNQSFLMTIEFSVSFNLAILNVKFKDTIKDFSGNGLKPTEKTKSKIKLKPFIYFNEKEMLYLNIMQYVIYVVLGLLVACFFPLLVLNSLGIFWQFLDMLQILNILMFLNVDYPIQVIEFLGSLSVSNLEMGVYSSYFVIQNLEYHEDYTKIPSRFREHQRPSRFFKNAGMAVTFWGVIVILYVISKTFTCIFLAKKKEAQIIKSLFYRIILRVNEWTEYSAIVRGFLVIFVQINISCFLQFRNLKFEDQGTQLNSSLAIISLILTVYFILFSFYMVNNLHFDDEEDENIQKFYPLIDLLKPHSIFKRNFINFYTIRKLMWVLCLVYLEDYPLSQMFLVILASAFIVTIHFIKNPYKDPYVNHVNFFIETGILLALLFTALIMVVDFVYSPNYLDIDRRSFYGWVIIVILSIIIFLKLLFVLWGIIINIKDILPKTKAMIKDLKDDKIEENIEMAELNNVDEKVENEEEDDFFAESYRKLYEDTGKTYLDPQRTVNKVSNFAPQNAGNNLNPHNNNDDTVNTELSSNNFGKTSKGKPRSILRPSVTFNNAPANSLKVFYAGGENKI